MLWALIKLREKGEEGSWAESTEVEDRGGSKSPPKQFPLRPQTLQPEFANGAMS